MEIYAQDTSVVQRYADRLGVDPELVRRASLREGGRIVQLPPYREVLLDVLDLSTPNTTGTFKSWLACVAVARCLGAGHKLVLAQSSGNTANALAAYAAHAGLRAVLLHPPASRRRILPQLVEAETVQLVEIDAAEQRIKAVLTAAAASSGVPSVPTPRDQDQANKARAYFLRDAARELGRQWDWHVQAISSAYGPLGFYEGVREIRRTDRAGLRTPRFLGVQQEAVTPFVRALTGREETPDAAMLEPTLFRRVLTDDLVTRMRALCAESRGTVRHLPNARYLELEPQALAMLLAAGVRVTRDADGLPRERAGLYSLAGALDAVGQGVIRPGERVLAVYTGGSAPAPDGTYHPHWVAREDDAPSVVARALDALRH
ncbi:pyridoxal-phosphate dependent enzyme [Streptomyces sp. UNOC14_S4]|uniref:pyridoxal-phosphate dependent enzyme n=1 Tax=Streptomyces sp. UNOC14_S4 TaxID=2872340 RepID=UPI001E348283|nr:pyridoxal-phosphate dependent enzyme [Streptomyces sp. UNOC14_S4]MCC3771124.1 pyridoxal-phosphate dependent enzyme [Streptomyces sp. UNOC14_S4]